MNGSLFTCYSSTICRIKVRKFVFPLILRHFFLVSFSGEVNIFSHSIFPIKVLICKDILLNLRENQTPTHFKAFSNTLPQVSQNKNCVLHCTIYNTISIFPNFFVNIWYASSSPNIFPNLIIPTPSYNSDYNLLHVRNLSWFV